VIAYLRRRRNGAYPIRSQNNLDNYIIA